MPCRQSQGLLQVNASTQYPTRPLEFYGEGIKYLKDTEIKGRLIVIEGPDGSGRSTQIQSIIAKLESDGHAVVNTGLKESELIGQGILDAKQKLPLGKKHSRCFMQRISSTS